MVKIAMNGLAAQLSQTRKQMANLERENKLLRLENRRLKALVAPRTSTTPTPPPTPTSKSDDQKSPRLKTRFDSPTQAFTNRVTQKRVERVDRTKVRVDGVTYVYANGRPLQLDAKPRYMQETRSFHVKHKEALVGSSWGVSTSSSSSGWDGWGISSTEDDTTSSDTTASEVTADTEDTGDETLPTQTNLRSSGEINELISESVLKYFPQNKVWISSKIGFQILTAGHRIAQQTFYDAARQFWPKLFRRFEDGPQLVRLGRDEMHSYIGEACNIVDLTLCGCNQSSVYDALMDLVHLRNAICHPGTGSQQDIYTLDNHLRSVEKFTIALGNDEQSALIRSLRGELRKEATGSLDACNRYSPLAALPFAGEVDPQWEPYQIGMFREILDQAAIGRWEAYTDEEKNLYMGLFRVAHAWAAANRPELLERVGLYA
ncbi:hypothetical protein F4818DRAFT_454993 [Hypoxylon cercidicola]|nr:hypothetical protein F4818DRAFT_454993 [Hypoxylon cercidicola]